MGKSLFSKNIRYSPCCCCMGSRALALELEELEAFRARGFRETRSSKGQKFNGACCFVLKGLSNA